VDLGYVVAGFNEDELIDFATPIPPTFPIQSRPAIFPITATANITAANVSAVPEPSALVLLITGMTGLVLRRQRPRY
jgi:hypothetical protein